MRSTEVGMATDMCSLCSLVSGHGQQCSEHGFAGFARQSSSAPTFSYGIGEYLRCLSSVCVLLSGL